MYLNITVTGTTTGREEARLAKKDNKTVDGKSYVLSYHNAYVMDPRLTEEQRQLQETTQKFLENNGGIEFARRKIDGDEAVVDEVWDEIADLDFAAITVPMEYGGFGEGMLYLATLLEILGKYAVPGPYPETMAFAVPLIDELGTDKQKESEFEKIADGNRRYSFALYDTVGDEVPRAITMDAEAVDGGFRLSGTKTLVPYGGEVDRVVVAARTQDATGFEGISTFIVDPADGEARELESLDSSRPMYELEFDGVEVGDEALLGPLHGGGESLRRAVDRFNVALCAMLVGGADRAVEMSVDYGNNRTQYGQPIGRFQAVKHRIAEMWIDTEHSRSLTYYAAWSLDAETKEAVVAVSMAKAYITDKLHRVFRDDIFNHGGMGFTWDHDGHIYLKQARAWKSFLGSPDSHLDRIADARNYSDRTLPGYPELTL